MNDVINDIDLEEERVTLNGKVYQVYRKQSVVSERLIPRLAVVSYLPEKASISILQLCIKAIKKFTDTPYELWICDNNSPFENIHWLLEEPNVNLVLNRTSVPEGGSYANAVGLELAAYFVRPDTQYFMALHQDTAPCKKGWLSYLLTKFDDKVKAVGVREDKSRVKEGILHVLGYIIDFQIFRQLNLSFYPDLPDYDVGDKPIVGIRENGYKYFNTPNTLWEQSLIPEIKDENFRNFSVDRSLDEDNEVIFLHLGRGVAKSQGEYLNSDKSLAAWENFINRHLLSLNQQPQDELAAIEHKVINDHWYSFRRYYVDHFFSTHIHRFEPGATVLDIGGKKQHKRGAFDIEEFPLDVKYANLDEGTQPDYLSDILNLPIDNNVFDGVILGEVLEHLLNPKKVLQEAYRVTKKGGIALITTPFMFHVHADPYDYHRYTRQWYQETLQGVGFHSIEIYEQGHFPAVLANLLKNWTYQWRHEGKPTNRFRKKIFNAISLKAMRWLWNWEKAGVHSLKGRLSGHTTGYGVTCRK